MASAKDEPMPTVLAARAASERRPCLSYGSAYTHIYIYTERVSMCVYIYIERDICMHIEIHMLCTVHLQEPK